MTRDSSVIRQAEDPLPELNGNCPCWPEAPNARRSAVLSPANSGSI